MSRTFLRLSLVSFAFLWLVGCGPAVREDRTIRFAPDGKQVAFQHGREGIFVAQTEGAEPQKIFQPDADTIAVGAPHFSPTDRRLLFTTAKSQANVNAPGARLPAEGDPAGNIYRQLPAVYTCWLRTEPRAGQPLNVPLFTARCGHPGYVAADLAVRWHPDGRHILYVEQDGNGKHGLYEFDLRSNVSRQVFPHAGANLVFDWAPDNAHLVCVLGDGNDGSKTAGVWVGKPGADDWWHVPDSAELGGQQIEDLRAARPAWAPDGDRFAFVTTRPGGEGKPARAALHVASLSRRTAATLDRAEQPIRDLHWRPDGARLGYLRGGETGSFHLADPATKSTREIKGLSACRFVGWDAGGERLAFVARQPLPHDPAKSWAFLLLPDVRARDRVLIAADAEPTRTRTVFSGMQVTFPHWSPRDAKLSLWATFRPPYRSWLSHLMDLGGDERDPLRGLTLRPGDPALVLDAATGERSWKAVNAHEQTQIGHYHLLRREYADAWGWYEKAAAAAPDATDRSPRQFVRRFLRGEDALFFRAHCLEKLGRADEARQARRRFEETFLPDLKAGPAPAAQPAAFGAADVRPTRGQLLHWRDLYAAEAFLSIDALEDGERYFRDGLKAADTDADRLSKSLLLTQFLLLRGAHEVYAEAATDLVLPLMVRAWKPRTRPAGGDQTMNLLLAYSDGLGLLPLMAPDFLAGLPAQQVRGLVPRWQRQRAAANDDVKRLGIDLFLHAAARRLGQKDVEQAAAARIAANPARGDFLGDRGVAGLVEGVRGAPEALATLQNMSH